MPFVTCDACSAESMAPRELVGLRWACPKCGEAIAVTDGDTSPSVSRRKRKRQSPLLVAAIPVLTIAVVCAIVLAKSGRKPETGKPTTVHQTLTSGGSPTKAAPTPSLPFTLPPERSPAIANKKPVAGQAMTVTGRLKVVSMDAMDAIGAILGEANQDRGVVVLVLDNRREVICRFPPKSSDQMMKLVNVPLGSELTIRGKFDSQVAETTILEDCSFVGF